MKEIELTQSKVAFVDDEDFDYLNQWKWCVIKSKAKGITRWYAVRNEIKTHKQLMMHRIIMNTPKHMQVDHIDHDGLNNQRNNLRNCTHQQNGINRTSFGKSKYLGVSFYYDRNGKQFIRAAIRYKDKQIYLGTFKTEEYAAIAYDNAAKLYHGEFANLNFK